MFPRKTVCLGLYIDKTCAPEVFSESLLNTDTCDIPFERYFLKDAINHTKRGRGGHRLDCQVPEMEK